ncbi:MAG TPA: ATP-binding protein [Verrucomicrobiae bacterium]|nr:ATP-binding protein [Verrucomicrobiae bacterium]
MGPSGLRFRLAGTILVAIVPPLAALSITGTTWLAWSTAVLAAIATAWGIHHFLLRDLRLLMGTAERLRSGDLSARTSLVARCDEVAALAEEFNRMAASLEQRTRELEKETQRSLDRALQQAAVAAIGQCALTSSDINILLTQAANLVSQTLEVPFCRILERLPNGNSMLLRAGTGWRKGIVGIALIDGDPRSQAGFTLESGEPVVISDVRREFRFSNDPMLGEHRVVSGASVAIASRGQTYGVLAIYTVFRREFTNDEVQFLLATANVLAAAMEHSRSTVELHKVADFARLNPNPALELDHEGAITYSNDAALQLAQSAGKEAPAALLPAELKAEVKSCLATGDTLLNREFRVDNHVLSVSLHPLPGTRVVHCYISNITDRLNLEEQLRQSQKMESVGQLAAGVAHDFNNMLTVIQGHAGILMTRSALAPELRDSVQSVSFAAERAASLTRQLLMFSRKSVIQPRFLDVREIITAMVKLLKRLLGESISLEFEPPEKLFMVHADPAMLEQVIMNLAVNARDAMAMGGTLRISVANAKIESEYVATHPDAHEGDFVRVTVSDSGHGMKPETMARIFEPFFTTKPPGKGTGLGLATVYGVVKQHRGWIEVTSDYGNGTTFVLHFPADSKAPSAQAGRALAAPEATGGSETILLVEDEPSVLALGRMILQDCGYKVIEAASGLDALEVWNQFEGKIDLLLTDMIMPHGICGLDLAEQLAAANPDLRILFTSGYCVDQFDTEMFQHDAALFLQKPYTRSTLARAVRNRLDQGGTLFQVAEATELIGRG